jgi:hypothetical protein
MDDTQLSILEALEAVTVSVKAWTSTELDKISKKIADLEYEEIQITSFSSNTSIAELGSTVQVELSWKLNKDPVSQTINGASIDISNRSHTLNDVSSDKTFSLKVTDEREASSSKSTSIAFVNGVYYGAVQDGTEIDSVVILGLTKVLRKPKTAITFTTTAESGERIIYALPSSYGTPILSQGGFTGGFYKETTIEFENVHGHTKSYDIWLSDNVGLGETTIQVTY